MAQQDLFVLFSPSYPYTVTDVWFVKYFSKNWFLILCIFPLSTSILSAQFLQEEERAKKKNVGMEIIFSSAEKISSPGMSWKNLVQTEKVKYTA